jgi:dTDP-4-amino-4,6-dideoxygalactose transaminase
MRGHTSDMDKILLHCERLELPVIEDAAHSLGTTWRGKNIGTFGQLGCFSFQSYKLLNSGEGGMLVTNDPDYFAKAVVMSGAYEHNWKKHQGEQEFFEKWQNQLPLYNMRLSNLSALIVNAQLPYLEQRVKNGRRNHDIAAEKLSVSEWIHMPEKFEQEARAPDSIQFNLVGLTPPEVNQFCDLINRMGIKLQVFGHSKDNARAFWNWDFLPEKYNLPKTREMLKNACDLRLPARLNVDDCQNIAELILEALRQIKNDVAA